MVKSLLLAAATATLLSTGGISSARADDYNLTVLGDEVPSPDQFVEALKPQTQGGALTLRGLRREPFDSVDTQPPRAVAFKVEFNFDSFDLTAPARQALDNLAVALETPELNGQPYLLEGHTDSVGAENYNQWLSSKRAVATKRYLVEKHGIDPQRLSTAGLGESRLLDPRRPRSAVNRRVQIVSNALR
ncbi:MAG: OmpA family protein [Gammaproteobacteria bacterium]